MFKLQKVVKLAIGSFGVDEVLEGIDYFFDGDNLFIFFMLRFVDDSVCSFTNFVDYFIVFIDLVFKFFSLFHDDD